MKRILLLGRTLVFGIAVFAFSAAPAAAEYRSSYREREYEETGTFEDAVDLEKFRKGNPEWDTQELIVSGFKALHEENRRILAELQELKSAVNRFENPASVDTATKQEGKKQGYRR